MALKSAYLGWIETGWQVYDVNDNLLENVNKPSEVVGVCRRQPHIYNHMSLVLYVSNICLDH